MSERPSPCSQHHWDSPSKSEWALLVPSWTVVLVILTYVSYSAIAIRSTPSFNDMSAITGSLSCSLSICQNLTIFCRFTHRSTISGRHPPQFVPGFCRKWLDSRALRYPDWCCQHGPLPWGTTPCNPCETWDTSVNNILYYVVNCANFSCDVRQIQWLWILSSAYWSNSFLSHK